MSDDDDIVHAAKFDRRDSGEGCGVSSTAQEPLAEAQLCPQSSVLGVTPLPLPLVRALSRQTAALTVRGTPAHPPCATVFNNQPTTDPARRLTVPLLPQSSGTQRCMYPALHRTVSARSRDDCVRDIQ